MPASLPGDRVRLAGRITLWAVGGFLLLFVVAAAWVGVRGAIAAYHLAQIRADAADVVSTLAADPAGALVRLNDLGEHTRAAQELTSDPVWSSFEVVPWVGPQLSAAQTVSASADELLRQGVLPLAEASQGVSMNALKPVDGRIDFGALETIEEPAQRAAARADSALRAVEGIDRTPLLGRLSDSVDQVEDVFSRAAGALDALSRATRILPGMLGESGPRTYLVLVQNNAEFRSLGGIAGTTLLLQTDHGSVSLVGTETGSALSTGIVEPVIELPHDVQDIYGTRPARFFQNVTQIPDFTLDGPLARDIYLRQTGKDVDGVLAVDPVVLSYLLKATGPVTLPDGETIKADNATSLFLRDVYQRFPNTSDQDAFFAASSASIFSAFLEGRGSSASILSALARGVDERRVMLWSAHADEQQLIAGSSLAGELPRTDGGTARFGVFFNDGGGSKMSYYVKPDVSVAWTGCAIPGKDVPRQLTLSVSLSNTAAVDAATTLPTYVTANGWFGVAPGTAAIVGNIYLPSGYTLVSAQASNGASFTHDALQGRDVLSYGLNLPPQTEETIIVVVETPSSARTAEAIVTPTADSSITPLVSSTCDLARSPSLN